MGQVAGVQSEWIQLIGLKRIKILTVSLSGLRFSCLPPVSWLHRMNPCSASKFKWASLYHNNLPNLLIFQLTTHPSSLSLPRKPKAWFGIERVKRKFRSNNSGCLHIQQFSWTLTNRQCCEILPVKNCGHLQNQFCPDHQCYRISNRVSVSPK